MTRQSSDSGGPDIRKTIITCLYRSCRGTARGSLNHLTNVALRRQMAVGCPTRDTITFRVKGAATVPSLSGRDHLSPAEDHARGRGSAAAALPFAGVADGDFLEADPVVAGGARDVQVAVDGGAYREARVPPGGERGPAPRRESLVPQRRRRLAQQRPVADQDHRAVHGGQP